MRRVTGSTCSGQFNAVQFLRSLRCEQLRKKASRADRSGAIKALFEAAADVGPGGRSVVTTLVVTERW